MEVYVRRCIPISPFVRSFTFTVYYYAPFWVLGTLPPPLRWVHRCLPATCLPLRYTYRYHVLPPLSATVPVTIPINAFYGVLHRGLPVLHIPAICLGPPLHSLPLRSCVHVPFRYYVRCSRLPQLGTFRLPALFTRSTVLPFWVTHRYRTPPGLHSYICCSFIHLLLLMILQWYYDSVAMPTIRCCSCCSHSLLRYHIHRRFDRYPFDYRFYDSLCDSHIHSTVTIYSDWRIILFIHSDDSDSITFDSYHHYTCPTYDLTTHHDSWFLSRFYVVLGPISLRYGTFYDCHTIHDFTFAVTNFMMIDTIDDSIIRYSHSIPHLLSPPFPLGPTAAPDAIPAPPPPAI